MKSFYSVVILALVLLIIACQEKAMNPAVPQGPDFSVTPMENEEAELLALYLSGEIIAPAALYESIKRELNLIRQTWIDSLPEAGIQYRPYSEPSRIYVGLTQAAFDSSMIGLYHEWDSLNNYFRLDTIYLNPQFNLATLYFTGRLNSSVLVDKYAGVEGFAYVSTSARIGDWSTLVALIEGKEIKYFFRSAFGDCPSGCIYSNFFYFTVSDDSAIYHGSYLKGYLPDPTRPAWVDSAILALEEYRTLNSWHPE